MKKELYMQYGCGLNAPETWRNFDSSPSIIIQKIPLLGKIVKKQSITFPQNIEFGDIIKGLPVKPSTCNAIYASHVLEHLSLEDFRVALKNTYSLLVPNGFFRLVVPDLEVYAKEYLASENSNASIKFMKDTSLGLEKRNKSFTAFLRSWLGNSNHLWMWDYTSLEQELYSQNFIDIRRCTYNDSECTAFEAVERQDRYINALGIECRRPKE